MKRFFLPTVAVAVLLLAGCSYTAPQYQQQYTVPKGGWAYAFQPHFRFEITDTLSAYQLYFLVRHTNSYPYNNIWIRLASKIPGAGTKSERFEIALAEPPGVNADGSLSGRWLGRGMGEIWEQRMALYPLQQPLFFHHKGIYEVSMAQDMRISPLPELLQVGLRLERLGVPDTTRH